MGTCVICGSSADGDVCATHEEDVFFEFRGDRPDELTANRYYRGSVDGFAEFGVFVDIGPVTGLLHRSEIPKRLESLDWESGDTVFVQVLDVHPNGNIDLGWSLRQRPREFRGRLIDDPEVGKPVLPERIDGDGASEPEAEESEVSRGEPTPVESEPTDEQAASEQPVETAGDREEPNEKPVEKTEPASAEETGDVAAGESADGAVESSVTTTEAEPERVQIDELEANLEEMVTFEGTVTDIRQTAGPTVFELEDETGSVDCAAFESAGVRAYPEVEIADVLKLTGIVETHREAVQVETETLEVLEGAAADAVRERRESALEEQAQPTNTSLLTDDPTVVAIQEELVDAATAIRRAVFESRPIVIRHPASLSGYVGGAALERAVVPLIRDEHEEADAEFHYVDRRPLEDRLYDVDAATGDVTSLLEAADRHDEAAPLFVLVDAGSTTESVDGLALLSAYDADTVVVDGGYADTEATDATDWLVSPTAAGGGPVPSGVLGAHLGALLNDEVRGDLRHLPATSYWSDRPEHYETLASEAGYDQSAIDDVRNAIALEAYYQSYEDKRELIRDLFWAENNASLAAPLSEQFRQKLETEIETARPHLERHDAGGVRIDVLDVSAFTHRYDFPPTELLLAALHRRADENGPMVTIGLDEDELTIERSTALDVRAIGDAVADRVPDAGVTPRGGRDGRIEFLKGRREAVLDGVIEEVSAWLG
ncbi:MAG: OB-fold nucleic acid binding domain-containing protein [Halodesulfurarchaeum sp.]